MCLPRAEILEDPSGGWLDAVKDLGLVQVGIAGGPTLKTGRSKGYTPLCEGIYGVIISARFLQGD